MRDRKVGLYGYEWRILDVLWEDGDMALGKLCSALNYKHDWGNEVSKGYLQKMIDENRGYIAVDKGIYRASIKPEETYKRYNTFFDRAILYEGIWSYIRFKWRRAKVKYLKRKKSDHVSWIEKASVNSLEYLLLEVIWKNEGAKAADIVKKVPDSTDANAALIYFKLRDMQDIGYVERTDPGFICRSGIKKYQTRRIKYKTKELERNGGYDRWLQKCLKKK